VETAAGRPKAFITPHKNTLFNQTSAMARQRRRPTSKMAPAKSSRGAPAKLQQRREDTEVKKHAEFMARQVKIAAKIRMQDSSSSESEDNNVASAHIQVAKRGQKYVPEKDDLGGKQMFLPASSTRSEFQTVPKTCRSRG